jgi:hypothetical protein
MQGGGAGSSWPARSLHIGHDPERGDPALYRDLTVAQLRWHHSPEITIRPGVQPGQPVKVGVGSLPCKRDRALNLQPVGTSIRVEHED